jgi:DNA repair protein RecO (recombination protein O)
MHWRDEGFVLSARRFSESGAIVNILTREHGRHVGLLHGGGGRKGGALLQPGNAVNVEWRARLSEQLGHFRLEMASSLMALLFDDALRLGALESACAVADAALPEREPHPGAYAGFTNLRAILASGAEEWPEHFVRWELDLLAELGFGLDLGACAATGATTDLCYVSPNTGRAVGAEPGLPYRDKLLALPGFLRNEPEATPVSAQDLQDGLKLTGWFLETRVFQPHATATPPARLRLVERFARDIAKSGSITSE